MNSKIDDTGKSLQISTEVGEKCQVIIDGNAFDMQDPEHMELKEFLRIANTGKKISELLLRDDITDEDEKKLEKLVDDIVRELLPEVPAELHAKLNDIQKLAIMNFFSRAAKDTGAFMRLKPI